MARLTGEAEQLTAETLEKESTDMRQKQEA